MFDIDISGVLTRSNLLLTLDGKKSLLAVLMPIQLRETAAHICAANSNAYPNKDEINSLPV